MTTKLEIDLADILERKYPHGFHAPADIDISSFLEFADDDWSHEIDIDSLLEQDGQVALIWDIQDVLGRRPDISEDQAWEVLKRAKTDFLHDKCHLDFIECTANELFPPVPTAKDRLLSRVSAIRKKVETLPDSELADPAAYGAIACLIDSFEQVFSPIIDKTA